MARSLRKGPYIDERLLQKIATRKPDGKLVVKTWSRAATITPEMVGFAFGVHNGKQFVQVQVAEDMVGHRLGEFSPTTKFSRHGGRMQKELEEKQAQVASTAPASAPSTSLGATAGKPASKEEKK